MHFMITSWLHTSCDQPHERLAGLVYGHPRVEAVMVGSRGVGIVQWPDTPAGRYDCLSTQRVLSTGRYRREFTWEVSDDEATCVRQFGSLVRGFAPGEIVGVEAATSAVG